MAGQHEDMVRVFDFKTKQLTTIPARELAPGMVRGRMQGIDGEVWVDPSQTRDGPIRHPPFTETTREVLRGLQDAFRDVYPRTLEEWEEGFRHDADPEQEIALWVFMACVYDRFTTGQHLNDQQKKDIFNVILGCINNGPDKVSLTVSAPTLSRQRIKAIVDFIVRSRQSTLPKELQDDRLRSEMREADVIFGQDAATDRRVLFYGKEFLETIIASQQPADAKVVVVPYDSGTTDLEYLVALVRTLKGSDCYRQ